jgi:hypothetical protein
LVFDLEAKRLMLVLPRNTDLLISGDLNMSRGSAKCPCFGGFVEFPLLGKQLQQRLWTVSKC